MNLLTIFSVILHAQCGCGMVCAWLYLCLGYSPSVLRSVERCWWSERLKPNKPQNLKPVFSWNLTSAPEANVATTSNQSHPHLYDWQLKGANESTEWAKTTGRLSCVFMWERQNRWRDAVKEKKQENESPSGCGFRLVSHHGNGFSGCKFGFDQIVVKVCMCLRDGIWLCRQGRWKERPKKIFFFTLFIAELCVNLTEI